LLESKSTVNLLFLPFSRDNQDHKLRAEFSSLIFNLIRQEKVEKLIQISNDHVFNLYKKMLIKLLYVNFTLFRDLRLHCLVELTIQKQ
jgi:hypothetical protein